MGEPTAGAANLSGLPTGLVAHTFIRLGGAQSGDVTVHHAGTTSARVHVRWGGLLMTFFSAQAAQGVLEGFATVRNALAPVPAKLGHLVSEPYDQPSISVEWVRRPSFAVMSRSATDPKRGALVHWVDLYMGPVTFQVLDRAAFRSTVELLRLAHRTAVAVCPDGPDFVNDPTWDDYRPES